LPWRSRKKDKEDLPVLALDWTGTVSPILIGRSPDCDLLLLNRTVSHQHAELFWRDGRWHLVDLGSTNGTYVNGEPVQEAEIRRGDVVALGTERVRVD